MPQTLPTAANQTVEYEDYYESTLAQPLGTSDTDIFPESMPSSAVGFLVIDATGTTPETIFYNFKGANFVRCPSAVDGEGRGVFGTTPNTYQAGTKIGMYSIAAFFEGLATGRFMRDGFLQARHFSSSIDPNSFVGAGETLVFGTNVGSKMATYIVTGDKTGRYSPGTKFRLPRVAITNTKCLDLEASSSQYATVASPIGLTFTDVFTIEAWVKVESYQTNGNIIGRGGTSAGDWGLRINADGTVTIYGNNASSNGDIATSLEAVPLDKNVHVAAKLSMSGDTATLYINALPVPSTRINLGSGAAALTQGGPLYIGKNPSSSNFFDGKISEVRVWDTLRSDAQILANYNKRLVGSETNLVGYWRLDNDFVDLGLNMNTMTGVAGAVATAVDTPFATTEWGIVTDATFSGGNTTLSIYTGSASVPPAEDSTNAAYSNSRAPTGFPSAQQDWRIEVLINSSRTGNFVGGSDWETPLAFTLQVPIGKWLIGYEGNFEQNNGSTGPYDLRLALFDGTTMIDHTVARMSGSTNITSISQHWNKQVPTIITAQLKQLSFKQLVAAGAGTISATCRGDLAASTMFAQCPYI